MDSHTRRTGTLGLLFGLPVALLLVVVALESFGGGGHPSLGAVLLSWVSYPTLAGYLSRSLLGSDFPSTLLLFVAFLEYSLVAAGVVFLIATSKRPVAPRVALAALFLYAGAHGVAHLLLNLQPVNMRLMVHTNPSVSAAAVNRIRDSGADALPALQRKLVDDFERDGTLDAGILDALTALGGAKGWQDLLESGRLGVAGSAARAWRFVVDNVRAMINPMFAESRGGVPSRGFSDQDITRLSDSLALALATRLQAVPDSEAALTLLVVMKERRDLCVKYFEFVPLGLRNGVPQAARDLVSALALMKAGASADGQYEYQAMITKDEMSRYGRNREAVAQEWIAWAKGTAPCR
jgi:hypothetical protein